MESSPSLQTKMRRRPLLTLALVTATNLMGFGLLMPLLPFLAQYNGASPAFIGSIMAFYSLGQLVSSVFWGYTSDTRGRRWALLTSQTGFCISWALIALPFGLWWLLATRFLAGLFGGNIAVTFAAAADFAGAGRYAKANGLIGAALALGFTFGPAVGSLLGRVLDPPLLFTVTPLVAVLFSLLSILMIYFWIPEPLSRAQREKNKHSRRQKGFWILFAAFFQTDKPLKTVLSMTFLTILAWAGIEALLAVWCFRLFGWHVTEMGLVYLSLGLVSILFQGGISFPLSRVISRGTYFLLAAALSLGGFIALIFSAAPVPFYVSLLILGAGMGLLSPLLNTLLMEKSPTEQHGFVMGLGRSVGTLSRFLGPILYGNLFSLALWAPFGFGALLIFLAGFLFFYFLSPSFRRPAAVKNEGKEA